MQGVNRTLGKVRSFLLSYGPTPVKKAFWDREFASGKWNFIDNTVGDCVYEPLERYAAKGDILDLGCGPGNTANELDVSAYRTYTGVDISEEALIKARNRTKECGRAEKNSFEQGDFLGYAPRQKFDVILFRESMYHVPPGKVKTVLDRFAPYLKDGGVFVVRLFLGNRNTGAAKERPMAMMKTMEEEFAVIERSYGIETAAVIVFRPKATQKRTDLATAASNRRSLE
jgi:SAM-dependent methyltransferase